VRSDNGRIGSGPRRVGDARREHGTSLIDQLGGITLPGSVQSAAQTATQAVRQPQNLGTTPSISGNLALLTPFISGALGGLCGARTGRDSP
jgi:hypothetical protein